MVSQGTSHLFVIVSRLDMCYLDAHGELTLV